MKKLLTLCLALALTVAVGTAALLTTDKPSAKAAAETGNKTSVTSIYFEAPRIWICLSDTDYGTTATKKGEASLADLNTLTKIKVDGNYVASDISDADITSKDPYINLWSKLQGSFTLAIAPQSEIVIEQGCQFPSYDYWVNKNADGIVYEVKETVTYVKVNDNWTKQLPEVDISDTFFIDSLSSSSDSMVVQLATTADISAPSSAKWLIDNMPEIQNYLTINGMTVKSINQTVDDSTYEYKEFPGTLGGDFAVPVRPLFLTDSGKSIFRLYIHKDYIADIAADFSVGINTQFVRQNSDATNNMVVKNAVEFVKVPTKFVAPDNVMSLNLSVQDGLNSGDVDANGYYHGYVFADNYKLGTTNIGYKVIDDFTCFEMDKLMFVNGKSVAEINSTTDVSGWEWKVFPYTAGATYQVPILVYISDKNDKASIEFRIHENYLKLVDGDLTLTMKKGFKFYDETANTVYALDADMTGSIYYKSYDLAINIQGEETRNVKLKHTAELNLDDFCPAKDGYAFSGWFTDVAMENAATAVNMPASDYAVYGKYNVVTYECELNLSDGTKKSVNYTIENRAEKLTELKALLGKSDKQYAYTSDLPDVLPLENGKTYTETKTAIRYTVTFKADGETVATETYTVENKTVNEPAVPAKKGYDGAWSKYELNFENIEVTAEYTFGKAAGFSVSLAGDIGLNFYATLSADTDEMTAQVTFKGETVTVKGVKTDKVAGNAFVFRFPVAPKDYKENVAFVVTTLGGDTITATSSVKEYADKFAEGEDGYALVQKMLAYCEAARVYFAAETVDTAKDFTADLTAFAATVSGTDDDITVEGATLVLEDTTEIKLYFTCADLTGKTFKVGNSEVTPEAVTGVENCYVLRLKNIVMKDIDELYDFTLGGKTVRYGALSYVKATLEDKDTSISLGNLVKTLYELNVAANAYFAA